MNISPDPLVWLSALLTLFIFSFLFRDNILYQFAEHLFVGISAGYLIAITWHNQMLPNLFEPLFLRGNILYIIPLLFGLCYFARFIPKIGYLVRLPIAFMLGWGSGAIIPAITSCACSPAESSSSPGSSTSTTRSYPTSTSA